MLFSLVVLGDPEDSWDTTGLPLAMLQDYVVMGVTCKPVVDLYPVVVEHIGKCHNYNTISHPASL